MLPPADLEYEVCLFTSPTNCTFKEWVYVLQAITLNAVYLLLYHEETPLVEASPPQEFNDFTRRCLCLPLHGELRTSGVCVCWLCDQSDNNWFICVSCCPCSFPVSFLSQLSYRWSMSTVHLYIIRFILSSPPLHLPTLSFSFFFVCHVYLFHVQSWLLVCWSVLILKQIYHRNSVDQRWAAQNPLSLSLISRVVLGVCLPRCPAAPNQMGWPGLKLQWWY